MAERELVERLERIERLLREVRESLEHLEGLLREAGLEASLALSIALGLSRPVLEALEAARRVAPLLEVLDADEVTRSILVVLALCEPLSISEVYRRVRRLRGRASRSTIASRLRVLEERGVVVNLGSGRRPRYTLRTCLGGGEA